MLRIFKYFSIGDGCAHNYQEDLPPHIPVQLHVSILVINVMHVFNQVCAGHRPVQAWFLVIAFLLEVCACGCVCACVCIFVCVRACVHGCVFVCVFMCVYVCASVCVCLYLCLCLYVCLCLCVILFVHVYMRVYLYPCSQG